jgi:hypothetical protein
VLTEKLKLLQTWLNEPRGVEFKNVFKCRDCGTGSIKNLPFRFEDLEVQILQVHVVYLCFPFKKSCILKFIHCE